MPILALTFHSPRYDHLALRRLVAQVDDAVKQVPSVAETGMIRFRLIMLTALAVVAGATVILTDPIFQGLAIALMAGSLVSMFTAPVLVPLLYFMAKKHNHTQP